MTAITGVTGSRHWIRFLTGLGRNTDLCITLPGNRRVAENIKTGQTGVASVAAKFSPSFALGSVVFNRFDPALAAQLKKKAREA